MFRIAVLTVASFLPGLAAAQGAVTLDTFVRAETDNYFAQTATQTGVFSHLRDPVGIDDQTVIRMNRDTLYSSAVFDLTIPVTITLPDSGDRFMSMLVIDQDHYVKAVNYEPGDYTFAQEDVGTRYMFVMIRTFINPNDPADLAQAHALQDAITVTQESPGTLDLPDWDQDSLTAIRNLLNQLTPYQGTGTAFGTRDEVDPVAHLIGTAAGWGANPPNAAVYVFNQVDRNDGTTPYTLTVSDVPVDGFWSITVYNADGFMEDPIAQASLNNVTATPNDDGTVTVRFGGDPGAPNHLHIMDGWNYVVRLYRPRAEILDGTWTFPQPVVVE